MKKSLRRKILFLSSAAAATGLTTLLVRRDHGMDLQDKVVLITGGSRGLGLALARGFAKKGASLVLCARNEDELQAAKQDLASFGTAVMTVPCNVSDRAQVEHLIAATMERFGRLDILVNNAGTMQVGPVESMTVEDFQKAMDVMFWGTVYTTLAALPKMRHRPARIVNITSVGARVSVPHLLPYSCAKFAALAFSEGMRAELHGTGIKVITIAPGLMRTGSYLNALFKGDGEGEAAWFSVSASLPGLSMSVRRAADAIIAATRTGRAELTLSTPAKFLTRFHGMFPGATADILGLVSRLLPRPGNQTARGTEVACLQKSWLYVLTTLGRRAGRRLLQPGMP